MRPKEFDYEGMVNGLENVFFVFDVFDLFEFDDVDDAHDLESEVFLRCFVFDAHDAAERARAYRVEELELFESVVFFFFHFGVDHA